MERSDFDFDNGTLSGTSEADLKSLFKIFHGKLRAVSEEIRGEKSESVRSKLLLSKSYFFVKCGNIAKQIYQMNRNYKNKRSAVWARKSYICFNNAGEISKIAQPEKARLSFYNAGDMAFESYKVRGNIICAVKSFKAFLNATRYSTDTPDMKSELHLKASDVAEEIYDKEGNVEWLKEAYHHVTNSSFLESNPRGLYNLLKKGKDIVREIYNKSKDIHWKREEAFLADFLAEIYKKHLGNASYHFYDAGIINYHIYQKLEEIEYIRKSFVCFVKSILINTDRKQIANAANFAGKNAFELFIKTEKQVWKSRSQKLLKVFLAFYRHSHDREARQLVEAAESYIEFLNNYSKYKKKGFMKKMRTGFDKFFS